MSEEIVGLYADGLTIKDIVTILNMSFASISSYLPYNHSAYRLTGRSVEADNSARARVRRKAIQVISLLVKYKYDYDFNKIIHIADKLISGNKENTIRLQEAYNIKAVVLRKHGFNDDAKAVMIAYANELVQMADSKEGGNFQ